MKTTCKARIAFILLILLTTIHTISIAQPPPPPPNGGHGIGTNSPPGGGAPVGDGMFLLLGFASFYGLKKVYNISSKQVRSE
jgi:hypothetical protein